MQPRSPLHVQALNRIRANEPLKTSILAAIGAKSDHFAGFLREHTAGSRSAKRASDDPVKLLSAILEPRKTEKALEVPQGAEEAIIRVLGRPVLLVRDNTFEVPEVQYWAEVLTKAKAEIERAVVSVGRVEVGNNPRFSWLGTAWLIEENILVTNRHVAREFAEPVAGGFGFRSSMLGRMSARVDFREEFKVAKSAEFEVSGILDIIDSPGPDIAFLRIHWTSDSERRTRRPIPLAGEVTPGTPVAVLGYPAKDSRTTISDEMDRIYGNIYDVKRLAPGEIMQVSAEQGILTHDCTTLGGNSGSVLLNLASGSACGLHFAGLEQRANYAVSAPTLLRHLARARGRSTVVLSGSDLPTEMVGRNCRLSRYTPVDVPVFRIGSDFIAYASPDSTYAVTRRLFDRARKSILIGIYDFSASHMKDLVLSAMDRGVKVGLMLDIDNEKERTLFAELAGYGVECVPAPSCASKRSRYFASSHEKVIVIDELWTLVQSGNYSNNSIPRNEEEGEAARPHFKHGNRDMGVAVKSEALARFFTAILRSDMRLELTGDVDESVGSGMEMSLPSGEILLEAPSSPPLELFGSRKFNPPGRVTVTPVLSPDNYMSIIPALLESAQESIEIEQQYIRADQPLIARLLAAINEARHRRPGLEVRIIVAPPIGGNAESLERDLRGLESAGFAPGIHVRLLSPKHFVHCHNKLIVIDRTRVLISSQNWSDYAVSKNREAGLLMDYPDLANYYGTIFEHDWNDAESPAETELPDRPAFAAESLNRGGQRVRVALADFAET